MVRYVSQTQGLILTWLCPGLGHLACGMKLRARFFMLLLGSLFVIGQVLARGGAVNQEEHPFYFLLGQWWCGGMALLGMLCNAIVGGGGSRFNSYEVGQLYVTVAIVLNILVWVDLYRRLDAPGKMEDQ